MGSSISWDLVQYSTEHGGAKQHKPVVIRLQYNMGSSLSVLEREKESTTEGSYQHFKSLWANAII